MIDRISPEARSALMRAVRGKNTTPELIVRRMAHRLGARFRLYRKDLPGTPDLVFPSRRLCIFVNGCFWHRHEGCRLATTPSSNVNFWQEKFARNMQRDEEKARQLKLAGWKVETIWQCETRNPKRLEDRLRKILFPKE
ncbi:very short patch repair endonuclease [Xanthomonas axonopodis pv. poinsettiicola]|nr:MULTISPECIES: very short patch repair endonuclease [Xanthomonas]MBV6813271.1 very short patch repair endonuclease [Xanthomonas campestris pv. passiflorae]MBV6869735.1 very short patch repair endonuclease [Xanthomonas campestris pv. veroniae]MBV6887097.1 very short patch repair endonuclease [Xanthomonas campestris pv. spermacoces]MCC8536427.1 very short patch repair endonuclease [Xanthomonas codiaei]